MKFEIKHRYSGAVLFSVETESFRFAVEAAVSSGADLSRANLYGADLSGANLSRAVLSGAKGADFAIAQTRILPEGDLIGWKKVSTPEGGGIAKLRIPADAKRSHALGRKCRAEYVDVLEAPEGAYTERRTARARNTSRARA